MKKLINENESEKGFTIVELMIATSILSTILVLSTVMMINIGRLYYKGINQSRVQANVRNIVDDLTQQLRLYTVQPTPGLTDPPKIVGSVSMRALCVGSTRYTYVLNTQIGVGPGKVRHVLWRDKPNGGCTEPADMTQGVPPDGSEGIELMGPDSRLTWFGVSPISPYEVTVGVAYGDDDLLNLNGLNTRCRQSSANQFCATATLSTTVVKRLNSE